MINFKKNMDYKKLLKETFKNKKIIVTGHTGFKGSWLSYWLTLFGANVVGISNKVITSPSHYEAINLKKKTKKYFLRYFRQKKGFESF